MSDTIGANVKSLRPSRRRRPVLPNQKMSDARLKIGLTLRAKRQAQGFTLLGLSAFCGVNKAEISYIERGERNAKFSSITRLARALTIPLDDLGAFITW